MKKIHFFLYITFILFFIYACTMPSELEFIGSPTLKFAANMDFGDFFSEMTDNIIEKDKTTKIVPCTNPTLEYMAFVMRKEIFHKENYKCDVDLDLVPGDEGNIFIDKGDGFPIDIPVLLEENDAGKKLFVLENDKTIAETGEEGPYTITFEGIEEYLLGFEFSGVFAKIYISGSELADVISIELNRIKPEGTIPIVPDGEIIKGASGIKDLEEYTNIGLPEGGALIDINDVINTGGDLELTYRIFIPEKKEIELEWLEHLHNIEAEIVIWLPMTFESIEDNATINFPGSFDEISDAIKTFSGIGSIESMDMKIGISPLNPFGNGLFIMRNIDYPDIISPLDNHNFYFNFTIDDLDYINNNEFNPKFIISYPKKNSLLSVPSGNILITTITLNAKIKYNMELE